MQWTQPICERCWFDTDGYGWPEDNAENETKKVRLPSRVTEQDEIVVEKCAFCGGATIARIYVRKDPREVPFPADDTRN